MAGEVVARNDGRKSRGLNAEGISCLDEVGTTADAALEVVKTCVVGGRSLSIYTRVSSTSG